MILVSELPSRISTGVDSSRVVTLAKATTKRFKSYRNRVQSVVVDSYVFRWLTAEPEPEVVVIDLRDTCTIGPLVRALDASVEATAPAVDSSRAAGGVRTLVRAAMVAPVRLAGIGLGVVTAASLVVAALLGGIGSGEIMVGAVLLSLSLAATRVTVSWDDILASDAGQLLASAFEPPEPPESPRDGTRRETENDADDRRR